MTDTLLIRRASADDLRPLRALVERCYRGDSSRQGWTSEADLRDDERTSDRELGATLAAFDKRVLVAEADGRLIGTVTGADLGGSCAYMGMLAVDPAMQAQGLGRRLITAIEDLMARDFGATTIEMTVIEARPELIAYYQRCGYHDTGERRPFPVADPVPFGMVVLAKRLPA